MSRIATWRANAGEEGRNWPVNRFVIKRRGRGDPTHGPPVTHLPD